MKKIGKRGKMNQKARRMIADIAEERGLNTCEVKLPGCMKTFGIAPAHRKRRRFYKSAEELADYNEWVASCVKCHQRIDADKELLEETFKRLRG